MSKERYFKVQGNDWAKQGPLVAHHSVQSFLSLAEEKTPFSRKGEEPNPPSVCVNAFSAPLKIGVAEAGDNFKDVSSWQNTGIFSLVVRSHDGHHETEMVLEDHDVASAMSAMHIGRPVEKTVFAIRDGDFSDIDLEVMLFHGELEGLVLAVIQDTDNVRHLPPWVGDEVIISDRDLSLASPSELLEMAKVPLENAKKPSF